MTYRAPGSELERRIAALLQEVLQVERVGAEDNFFDLGGNSLLLVQFHRRLQETLGREIHAVEIFNHPTVRSLAARLGEGEAASAPAAGAAPAAPAAPAEDRSAKVRAGKDRLKQRLKKRQRD